jgi:SAM-dependent methyltransferase
LAAKYDTIGVDYADLRKPDPRIAARIDAALGGACTVLNVGAGTGSYEPTKRDVTALEPSSEQIRQRRSGAAPVVQGHAEALPFADNAFDAAMAVLTVHHWSDKAKGMAEMRRVSRGPLVILTFDPAQRGTWLTDYLPELVALDGAQMPGMADYETWLGPLEVTPVPIPHDCIDGFLYAYWRRPHAISTRASARRSRRSGSSTTWTPRWISSGAISTAAPGRRATETCSRGTTSTRATGWSSLADHRALARIQSSTTGAMRVRHLLPLKMP